VTLHVATLFVAAALTVGLFMAVAALVYGGRLIERAVYQLFNGRR
jgi:hypothetical protein